MISAKQAVERWEEWRILEIAGYAQGASDGDIPEWLAGKRLSESYMEQVCMGIAACKSDTSYRSLLDEVKKSPEYTGLSTKGKNPLTDLKTALAIIGFAYSPMGRIPSISEQSKSHAP